MRVDTKGTSLDWKIPIYDKNVYIGIPIYDIGGSYLDTYIHKYKLYIHKIQRASIICGFY